MAPELVLSKPYNGKVVDLFAHGIILFLLYSAHPPFTVASRNEKYYKLIT